MSQEFADSASFSKGQALTFVDKYSSFVYDEENNCYYAENFVLDEGNDDTTTVDDTIVNYIKIYIENGILAKMELKLPMGEDYGIQKYVFSDYGTTVIDNIPEWTLM